MLPEMFADGSEVTNEEKAVLHMDLNYNLRIEFLNLYYLVFLKDFWGPSTFGKDRQ